MAKPPRFACAILAIFMVPASGWAQDHVVSAAEVQARLTAAASARAAVLAHAELDPIRARIASLTDEELRDVAARAERLTVDPVAGTHPVIWVLAGLGVLLVLMFAILVVTCSAPGGCD